MLRQDITTNDWVILASQRAARPHRPRPLERPRLPAFDPDCPFCPGNESQTPPEITRDEGQDGWEQRTFPNLYPALRGEGDPERSGEAGFREMPGLGSHEVVVESPLHDERMDEMSPERVSSVLHMWRERYRELKEQSAVKAVVVFRNFGERAGTSLVHPHSQIVATPVFPPEALRRYAVATRYFDDTGHCVYDDLRESELRSGERVVAEGDGFVAVVPFAGRIPFETWVMPRVHETSFGRLSDAQIPELGRLLRDLLAALRTVAGDPDYNLVVQSAPAHEEEKPFFLWHLRLLARTSTDAGFELGSGMSINTMSPEDAAASLRQGLAEIRAA